MDAEKHNPLRHEYPGRSWTPDPPKVATVACIQREPQKAYCGMVLYPTSFMFTDAVRAVIVYGKGRRPGTNMQCCAGCEVAVRAERADEVAAYSEDAPRTR